MTSMQGSGGLMGRKKFRYRCQLQNGDTGQISERTLEVGWAPDRMEDYSSAVSSAAASMEWYASSRDAQKRPPFAGLTAVFEGTVLNGEFTPVEA